MDSMANFAGRNIDGSESILAVRVELVDSEHGI